MMDIVIPLGTGSRWQNNELRYALRGAERFVKDLGQVFIIGEKPNWIKNIVHIPLRDGRESTKNIVNKVLLACNQKELSENFLFMNDDHFLQEPVTKDYPFYYDFQISEKLKGRTVHGHYYFAQVNTIKALQQKGFDTLNYDVHFPVIYNKILFPTIMEMYDWKIPHGYTIKSLYCNSLEVKGTHYIDCKLQKRKVKAEIAKIIKKRPVFSIGDGALNGNLKFVLDQLYPKPSKFEIV